MINIKCIALLFSSFILSVPALIFAAAVDGEERASAAIAVIEGGISLPPGAFPLGEYSRYYSDGVGDNWYIHGMYVLDGKKDVHIVPFDEFPKILDGGCEVIRLKYDIKNKKMIFISCSGTA